MTAQLDTLAELLIECDDDPDLFNNRFLSDPENPTPFWDRQIEMCESVVEYRTTVIYSGNAIGKDFWVARLIWWWLATHEDALVIVTGPTQTLIGTVTWKEARRAIRNAPLEFRHKISQGAKNSPQTIEIAPGWHALGYSTTNVERQSGQHAEHLLVIVEEASGVEDEIWDAIESLGYERLVCIGNPIRAEGRFVDLIKQADKEKADGIPKRYATNAIQIPSTESPHAEWEKSPFGLADKPFIDSAKRRYGENSLWYKTHIKAEIPVVSADVLVELAVLDYYFAQTRPTLRSDHPVHGTRRLGCDLGEGVGRDSSCIVVRDNWGILECIWGSQLGLAEAAAIMDRLGRKWSIPAIRMSFDKLGIGKNFPNQLAKYKDFQGHGLQNARPYNGSGSPRDPSFANLRSEAAWRFRERLTADHVPDIRSPHLAQSSFYFYPDTYRDRLRREIEPLTYSFVGMHTKLMKKDDWAEVLGHSPDVADAIIQTFAFA